MNTESLRPAMHMRKRSLETVRFHILSTEPKRGKSICSSRAQFHPPKCPENSVLELSCKESEYLLSLLSGTCSCCLCTANTIHSSDARARRQRATNVTSSSWNVYILEMVTMIPKGIGKRTGLEMNRIS